MAKKASSKKKSESTVDRIIGIGSSAGGLEAIRELATNLPSDISCSYVVVQHMSPQHKSLMTTLIASETKLKVVDVTDGQLPEANVIHVTPPNTDIIIKKINSGSSTTKATPPSQNHP